MIMISTLIRLSVTISTIRKGRPYDPTSLLHFKYMNYSCSALSSSRNIPIYPIPSSLPSPPPHRSTSSILAPIFQTSPATSKTTDPAGEAGCGTPAPSIGDHFNGQQFQECTKHSRGCDKLESQQFFIQVPHSPI